MARRYTVSFEAVTVTAAQDLFQILGAASRVCRIIRVAVSEVSTTLATAQMLELRCRFLPATVTNGSGGSTPTPRKTDPGDAAATFTAFANNTTPATSNGTAVVIEENGCHIYSGYDYAFPTPPIVGPAEAFTFELLSTVTGTVKLSGTVLVEEIGG
jgi:hypothetical protein